MSSVKKKRGGAYSRLSEREILRIGIGEEEFGESYKSNGTVLLATRQTASRVDYGWIIILLVRLFKRHALEMHPNLNLFSHHSDPPATTSDDQ
jgi:hypothetical protein